MPLEALRPIASGVDTVGVARAKNPTAASGFFVFPSLPDCCGSLTFGADLPRPRPAKQKYRDVASNASDTPGQGP